MPTWTCNCRLPVRPAPRHPALATQITTPTGAAIHAAPQPSGKLASEMNFRRKPNELGTKSGRLTATKGRLRAPPPLHNSERNLTTAATPHQPPWACSAHSEARPPQSTRRHRTQANAPSDPPHRVQRKTQNERDAHEGHGPGALPAQAWAMVGFATIQIIAAPLRGSQARPPPPPCHPFEAAHGTRRICSNPASE